MHYGWVIVGILAVVQIIDSSISMAAGVMVAPLNDPDGRFGWGLGTIGAAMAVYFVFGAIYAPISGWLGDRYGARRMTVVFFSPSLRSRNFSPRYPIIVPPLVPGAVRVKPLSEAGFRSVRVKPKRGTMLSLMSPVSYGRAFGPRPLRQPYRWLLCCQDSVEGIHHPTHPIPKPYRGYPYPLSTRSTPLWPLGRTRRPL